MITTTPESAITPEQMIKALQAFEWDCRANHRIESANNYAAIRAYIEAHEAEQKPSTGWQLTDEAWKTIIENGSIDVTEHVAFEGDWGNWNWLINKILHPKPDEEE